MKRRILVIVVLMLSIVAIQGQELIKNSKSLSVEEAWENYFKAVKKRDMATMLSYVTDGNEIPFILGDGGLKHTRKEYIGFHEFWFGDKKWEMDIEIVNTTKYENGAIIIGKSSYYPDKESRSTVYYNLVTLVYQKQKGLWKIVGDVNTAITKKD